MKKKQLLAAMLCALSPLAHAEADVSLDEVVVTATRIEQPLKETLSSTTVITEDDIRQSQASDLPTLLRSVPGVELAQNGGTGKPASLFLRGANSTQVLVLLDGVRINSATTGTAAIQDLILDQIERIEIVRGNVSSVYGSEAIGGVVQIFTRKGRGEAKFNASVGAGNLGTQRISAGLGGESGNTQYNLQASSFETAGVSAINPSIYPKANPDNDGYLNQSVSANVKHTLSQGNSLTLRAFNSMGQNQYDSAYDLPTDVHASKQQLSRYSVASDNKLSNDWHSHLEYALGLDDSHNYKNNMQYATSRFKTSSQQVNWQNTLQLSDSGNMLFGVENLVQSVDSTIPYPITERTINGLYAGYTGNYGTHRVQANLRSDNNSQYGTENTGLLGYGYSLNDNWLLTASDSTAFRAPTLNELYYPGFGNAQVNPEHSNNAEAGMHYTSKERQLDLVYFDNRTRDLIVYVPLLVNSVPVNYVAVNVGQARIDGTELAYREFFGDFTLKAAYTAQNPRDETTGAPLVRRAKQHGSLALNHKAGNLRWGVEWINSGERTDSGQTLPAYDVFNLTAAYALNKETTLALRADNLTDQNDATVYGYNPLGRTLFVSLRYNQ